MSASSDEPSADGESSSKRGVWKRSFANRELRCLLGAMGVSQTGDWLYSVGLVVFVFNATHSVAWVGATVIARQAAYMSCSAVGGALADRFNRRRWMIGINLAEAVVLTTMAIVAGLHGPPAAVIALAFCAAAFASAYHPAVFATVPVVVGEDDLAAANAVVSTIEQTAMAAGPAIGALVVALASSSLAFALDAVTFLGAALLIRGINDAGRGDEGDERITMRERLGAGIRAIKSSPSAAVVVGMVVAALAGFGFEQVLYIAVSARRLGTGSSGVGALSAAYGLGGLASSLVVGKIAGRERPVPFMAAAFATTGLVLASLAVISTPAIAYVLLAIGGGSFVTFEVVGVTVLQRAVDPKLMGRVFGILMTLGSTATLLGSLAASALASGIGLRVALVVGGSIPLVVLMVVAPRLARLDRTTGARARELEPRVRVLAALGIFDGAPVASLEQLAATLTEQPVTTGEVVIREGDAADAFYVVRVGAFAVTVDRDGSPMKIDELEADDWFGEIGLVERAPRNATVTAATDGIVWRIVGDDFLAALEQAPGIPDALAWRMTARGLRARTARTLAAD